MPAVNIDLAGIADVLQEAVTNLEAVQETLGQKLNGNRHAERACVVIGFEVVQLASVLPALRDLLRDPREPRSTALTPQPIA
jgi:hypothetical protein